MGAEYERKYKAAESCLAAMEADYPGNWQKLAMQTTYYDTPSGSLSAKRYMLRSRLENGVSICTLKTPGNGIERGEWDVQQADITGAVAELCKLDVPEDLSSLCAEGLVPICGAKFTRHAQVLALPDCSVELALDRGILFSSKKELPLCEVELELKRGSKEALDAFAAAFAAKYDLQPEEKSKFARALALTKEV